MKFLIKALLSFIAVFFLFSCSTKQLSTLPSFEAKQFDQNMYSSKVDNFLILFDASSSMYYKYNGMRKFHIAGELVTRMNNTIPEMGQIAGLRSFGHSEKVTKKIFFGRKGRSKQMPNSLKGLSTYKSFFTFEVFFRDQDMKRQLDGC